MMSLGENLAGGSLKRMLRKNKVLSQESEQNYQHQYLL